jgi:hypothetical protein
MMKTMTWVIVLFCIHAFAKAQGPMISGDFKDLPFDAFTREVESQIPVRFVYRKAWTRDLRISASGDNMDLYKLLSDHLAGKDLFFSFSSDNRIFITRDHPLVTELPDYSGVSKTADRSHDSLDLPELTEAERLYIEGRRKGTIKTISIGDAADHISGQGAVLNGHIRNAETGEALVGATIFIQHVSSPRHLYYPF